MLGGIGLDDEHPVPRAREVVAVVVVLDPVEDAAAEREEGLGERPTGKGAPSGLIGHQRISAVVAGRRCVADGAHARPPGDPSPLAATGRMALPAAATWRGRPRAPRSSLVEAVAADMTGRPTSVSIRSSTDSDGI